MLRMNRFNALFVSLSLSLLRAKKTDNYILYIPVEIVGRALILKRAIQKRSHEPIYKTD